MKHFRLPQSWPELRLYPLPCLHIGAPQSDASFIQEHIARIAADPHGRWIYLGDGGECVVANSKGDIYSQMYNPQQQIDILTDLLQPIAAKGLFGVRGNHGHRVYKATGISFDKNLCKRIGIPYYGVRAFCALHVGRVRYDVYCHHGIDSGVGIQTKVSKAEYFGRFIDVDSILTAHSHVALDLPPQVLESTKGTKLRHSYICGCGYDSRTGYAADKGYPPLLPAFLIITYDGKVRKQSSIRIMSDGQHLVDGNYGYYEHWDI